MSNIVINVDGIKQIANHIKAKNSDIQSEYSKIKSKMNGLKNGWSGKACNSALNVISELNKQSSLRNHALEEYSNFLMNIVIPNAKKTSEENMKLKNRFNE